LKLKGGGGVRDPIINYGLEHKHKVMLTREPNKQPEKKRAMGKSHQSKKARVALSTSLGDT